MARAQHERAGNAGEIATNGENCKTGGTSKRGDGGDGASAELANRKAPARREQAREIGEDRTIGRTPVRAPVERGKRLVPRDLGCERSDLRARHVGRVGENEVEGTGEAAAPVGDAKDASFGEAKRRRVLPRERRGLGAAIDADPERSRKLGKDREQEATGAGAEIEHAKRRRAIGEGFERRLDQGFAFRARNERRGGDAEREAPELAPTADEGERLAGGAARDGGGEGRGRRSNRLEQSNFAEGRFDAGGTKERERGGGRQRQKPAKKRPPAFVRDRGTLLAGA